MSEENLALHQSSYDAWNRRDPDAWIGLPAADAEFTPVNVEMDGGRAFRGAAGARRHWENMLAIVPDIRVEADEIRVLGDVTVANVRLVGRGGESDASFDQRVWHVMAWRDRKWIWWASFRTEAEALEAAGDRRLS